MSGCTQTDNNTVSVIVLTYGDYSGLARTLDSILEQTCPVDQILVSDDGSDVPFPETLCRRYEDRVTFFRQPVNLGTVAHGNRAAAMTTGRYIKFLATGDAFSDPDALGHLVAFADAHGAVLTFSQSVVCSADLSKKLYRFPGKRAKRLAVDAAGQFAQLAAENVVSAVGSLFRRDFFTETGGFPEEYRLLEDWPTWLRLTRSGCPLAFLDRVTCLYAMGGVSSKNADAYAYKRLREDMLRCYKQEILPYRDRLTAGQARTVEYRYALLCEQPGATLWRRFFLLHAKTTLKRGIKRCLSK